MSTTRERPEDSDPPPRAGAPPDGGGQPPQGASPSPESSGEGQSPQGGGTPESSSEGQPPGPGDDYRLSPEEEADGELFLTELSLAEGLPAELAYPSDEFVRWYRRLAYPKATQLVFQDQDLYDQLCAFCRDMANVLVNPDGRITQVFCLHCCAVISEYGPNRCTGGSRNCIGTRYVDAVGAVALLCNGCHRYEERARGEAEKRRARARAPASGKARAKGPGRARTPAKNPQ